MLDSQGGDLGRSETVSYSETVPVQKKYTFEERAEPQLEGKFQVAVGEAPPTDAGAPQEAPGDTQGTPCLGSDSPCPLGCIDSEAPSGVSVCLESSIFIFIYLFLWHRVL